MSRIQKARRSVNEKEKWEKALTRSIDIIEDDDYMNHVMPREVDNSRIRVVFPIIVKFVPSKIMRAPSQSPRTRLLITLYMRHSNLSTRS